jgi:flagellar protein FlaG
MEATQSLKVQRFQTGYVDITSMGNPTSSASDKSGVNPVQSSDQVDLKTRDQIGSKNQERLDEKIKDQIDEKIRDQQKPSESNKDAMPDLLKALENKVNLMQEVGLQFSQYKDSGKIIIKVVEKGTDKVIREIPSEEFLDFVEKMDQMIGILFDKKV